MVNSATRAHRRDAPGSSGSHRRSGPLSAGSRWVRWFFITEPPELAPVLAGKYSPSVDFIRRRGVVFYAHPRHHRYPWAVADRVANVAIRHSVFRQAFKLHKRQLAVALRPWLRPMDAVVSMDSWQGAAAHQRPSQVCIMHMVFRNIRFGHATGLLLSN